VAPGSQSKVDWVAQELQSQLTRGAIPPGTRLSQTELAARFGVSRIPLREALQQLASLGILQVESSGTVVVAPLSVEELQEVYEIREAVEPMLARLATPNVGRAQILQMRSILERMRATEDSVEWMVLNTRFHRTAYQCVNRPRMLQIADLYAGLSDRYIHVQLGIVGDTSAFDEEHAGILRAIEAQDSQEAARLTCEHLAASHEFVLQYFLGKGNFAS
jgi:DNA-binding GntR family transcriptional regulator